MKIKILLGCIGAVVILILVSFTNVVGLQSTKSCAKGDSPLFSFRTCKATKNQYNSILTSDYLGKGINTLSFPLRDNRKALIQKTIERIRTMNDESFNHFKGVVLNQICHRNLYMDFTPLDIEIVLHQIRNNIFLGKNYVTYLESNNKSRPPSYGETVCQWVPGCFLYIFISILLQILSILINAVINIQTALGIGNCGTYCCTIDHGCTYFPDS